MGPKNGPRIDSALFKKRLVMNIYIYLMYIILYILYINIYYVYMITNTMRACT